MNATALERKLMPTKIPSSMPASSGLLVKRTALKMPVIIPSSKKPTPREFFSNSECGC